MNKEIVKRFNEIVKPEDEVYILGDLCLGGTNSLANNKSLIESLNGKIHIIFGNHCTETRKAMYMNCKNVIECCGYSTILKYKKYTFYLSHWPTKVTNFDKTKFFFCLCGHSHTKNKWADKELGCYHVEWDAQVKPVSIEEILNDIQENF